MRFAAFFIVLFIVGCGSSASPKDGSESGPRASRLTVYWVGPSMAGAKVISTQRDPKEGVMIDYGRSRCRSGGCPASFGLHTTDQESARHQGSIPKVVRRRGVPVVFSPNGKYAAVFTGRETVMIGGRNRALIERVIEQMRPKGGRPGGRLPAPTGFVPGTRG